MDQFDDIVRLLREERPEASELELDRIKRRVMARTPRKGQPMRSRLAILAMLVMGMLLSGTGAGLAVQGLGDGDDASEVQYPPKNEGNVLGEEDSGGNLPEEEAVEEDAQVAQQVEAGDSLPFTGFVAIPVLVGGVALLAGGMVLRRKSS
jgi:hypothetical protein